MTNDSQFIYERDDAGPAVGGASWLPLMVHVSGPGANESLELYTHGPDLSGTLGAAGGIGGILTCHGGTGSTPSYYHCDGNGNVIAMSDTNGTLISRLDYAPFGTVLTSSGPTPRFQWSSKEWDEVVGFSYYGYRYNSPHMGRWLSRDPLQELGSYDFLPSHNRPPRKGFVGFFLSRASLSFHVNAPNAYTFLHNSPGDRIDPFGLSDCVCPPGSRLGRKQRDDWNPAEHVNGCTGVGPGPYDFTDCCNEHDICYGTCNSGKANCDNQFFDCMRQRCSDYCGTDFWCNFGCDLTAQIYYAGVFWGGGSFYEHAQDRACEDCCCP